MGTKTGKNMVNLFFTNGGGRGVGCRQRQTVWRLLDLKLRVNSLSSVLDRVYMFAGVANLTYEG